MEKNFKIYMHKNKVNGKVYIGQTYTELERRFGKDGIGYKGCPFFYNAIKKYGWENFEHYILEDRIKTQNEANKKEVYYISLYNAMDPKHGYNIKKGGVDNTVCEIEVFQYDLNGNFIKRFKSITEAQQECHVSNGKITACCKGERKSTKGYMWSYVKYDCLPKYNKKSKSRPVYQYSMDGLFIRGFNTVMEAVSYLGVKNGSEIRECCKGRCKTSFGYQWRHQEYPFIEDLTKPKERIILKYSLNGKLLDKYLSLEDAISSVEGKYQNTRIAILSNLKQKNQSACGFIWKDIDDASAPIYPYLPKKIAQYNVEMNHIKTYSSAKEAAKENECDEVAIRSCACGHIKTAYGYIWKYVE